MKSYSQISHRNLEICSPVTWKTYEQLLSMAVISSVPQILDIGCGKCGVLANAVDYFKGNGTGVDLAESMALELTPLGKILMANHMLEVKFQEAATFMKENVLKYDLIICIGSSHALGDLQNALKQFRSILRPGGALLIGELIWKSNPSADFLNFLECNKEDQLFSHELHSLIENNDFNIISNLLCPDTDFENYEQSLRASIEKWCIENPGSEQAEKYIHRANRWWEAREKWAREVLGFEVILAN